MTAQSFPALRYLFGCYFHQDFDLESGSPDGAVNTYLSQNPAEAVEAASSELERVIPLIPEMENAQRFLLEDLGCCFAPHAADLTVVEWLRHVQVLLLAHLHSKRSGL